MNPGRRPVSFLWTATIGGVLMACDAVSDGEGAERCAIEDAAGPTVENSASGEWGDEPGKAREVWRAGGLAEGEELVQPAEVAAGPDGQVAIPDFRLTEVPIVSRDGDWLGSPVQAGEGPGEVNVASAAAWSGGGELALLDWGNARVEILDAELEPSETVPINPELAAAVFAGGEIPWNAVQPDGTVFVELSASDMGPDSARRVVVRAEPGAESADTLLSRRFPVVSTGGYGALPVPDHPTTRVGAGGDRWALARSSETYEVEVYQGGSEPGQDDALVHFCRGVAEAERDAASARDWLFDPDTVAFEGAGELLDELRDDPAPGQPALFHRIEVDRDGRVWLERDPPVPSTLDRTYGVPGSVQDVFGAGGKYLGTVRLPEGLRFQDASGDAIFALEIGDLDEFHVVRLELPHSPLARVTPR